MAESEIKSAEEPCGCEKRFSSSYMLLDHEEVKFWDLIHILFSTNLEKRKFVDSAEDREDCFERRWIMFVSIVAQKFVHFVAKPMAFLGSGMEMWLNLLSSNHGFSRLLLNCVTGKLVVPDKDSASFVSFIGQFDVRNELDKSIKHGDPRYNPSLSMMASKASYENKAYLESIVKDHWEMELIGSYDFWNYYQEKATTQAFIFRDKTEDHDTIVVAFRGTEPFDADAWCSDFDLSWYELHGIGRIHGGFMKALGLQKGVGWPKEQVEHDGSVRPAPLAYYAIRDILKDILLQNGQAKYILTGHSLGGALAILFPAVLAFHDEKLLMDRLEGVYTFGQPRVGDEDFGTYMEHKLRNSHIPYFRFVYAYDMVPRLPYDDKALMFKHFGTCIFYNRHYEAKIVEEEPNKNYFSPIGAIPMMANAFCEFIRSFTVVRKRGKPFRENGFLKSFRVIGLVMPGMSGHNPYDYINATCLGPPQVLIPDFSSPNGPTQQPDPTIN